MFAHGSAEVRQRVFAEVRQGFGRGSLRFRQGSSRFAVVREGSLRFAKARSKVRQWFVEVHQDWLRFA